MIRRRTTFLQNVHSKICLKVSNLLPELKSGYPLGSLTLLWPQTAPNLEFRCIVLLKNAARVIFWRKFDLRWCIEKDFGTAPKIYPKNRLPAVDPDSKSKSLNGKEKESGATKWTIPDQDILETAMQDFHNHIMPAVTSISQTLTDQDPAAR